MSQPSLFDAVEAQAQPLPGLPPGFAYAPELITAAQAATLVERVQALPFAPFAFQGFEGLRRVVSFGWRYDHTTHRADPAEAIPAWLLPLREKAASFADLAPEALVQALVTEYAPGAPIGWHRDRPLFEDVVGLSLGSAATLRLRRRRATGAFERRSLTLEPRSAYLLRGEVRWAWEHSIPPTRALRYSVTFRSLRA